MADHHLDRIAWALEGIELQLEYRRLQKAKRINDLQWVLLELDARRLAYVKSGWASPDEGHTRQTEAVTGDLAAYFEDDPDG